jgi:hypothetical protein
MSRLGVLVIRRFVCRDRQGLIELHRATELAIPPFHGMVLSFADGSPDCTVSWVRHRVGVTPTNGIVPIEVELIGCKEPEPALTACREAGWQPAQAPAGV